MITNENEFLSYLNKIGINEFQSKGLSEYLKRDLNIPKSKTKQFISILKHKDMINRVSESGYCKTTCASCYEYGCDAGQRPPINYWKVREEFWSIEKIEYKREHTENYF